MFLTAANQFALDLAIAAHTDQRRKYTDLPYVTHPFSVATIVGSVPHSPEMISAALLHDVVEDTDVTIEEVITQFGEEVGEMVAGLTDVSTPEDGNRETRKRIDREHTAAQSPSTKTIKLADLIDNTMTIKHLDPAFWTVYRREKILLLEVLKEGDPELWKWAARLALEKETTS